MQRLSEDPEDLIEKYGAAGAGPLGDGCLPRRSPLLAADVRSLNCAIRLLPTPPNSCGGKAPGATPSSRQRLPDGRRGAGYLERRRLAAATATFRLDGLPARADRRSLARAVVRRDCRREIVLRRAAGFERERLDQDSRDWPEIEVGSPDFAAKLKVAYFGGPNVARAVLEAGTQLPVTEAQRLLDRETLLHLKFQGCMAARSARNRNALHS